ncbi:hypothetical protein SAMN05428959_10346 [Duganella sp. CF517]|uniref:hypothetical protein n=1 Tax=Duganella sp. CF517 TaxID=1881038 RepID=UPI0008B2931D|nr:hypothetical protein [Duganella sp. CF517]SEN77128.1 hypothetical protein SAMN05428959_10346 [Duganella sp. CF517]
MSTKPVKPVKPVKPKPVKPIKPTQPGRAVLEVTFDADQDSTELDPVLRRDPPIEQDDSNPARGKHADSLYFIAGDELALRVIGGGDRTGKSGFVAFQIVDCAIITRPKVARRDADVRTLYFPPSLFTQATGASYQLALDFAPKVSQNDKDYLQITQDWKPTLNVGFSPGMWELSFTMTVRIARGLGEIDEIRVFTFDPETEVGGPGTTPKSAKPVK